jgi:hypothetical protein
MNIPVIFVELRHYGGWIDGTMIEAHTGDGVRFTVVNETGNVPVSNMTPLLLVMLLSKGHMRYVPYINKQEMYTQIFKDSDG